jgi:hypothetical protein
MINQDNTESGETLDVKPSPSAGKKETKKEAALAAKKSCCVTKIDGCGSCCIPNYD